MFKKAFRDEELCNCAKAINKRAEARMRELGGLGMQALVVMGLEVTDSGNSFELT